MNELFSQIKMFEWKENFVILWYRILGWRTFLNYCQLDSGPIWTEEEQRTTKSS